MRATKLVITIKNLTYKDRLKWLKLPTLKYRRIRPRGDMIEVGLYKILTNRPRVITQLPGRYFPAVYNSGSGHT